MKIKILILTFGLIFKIFVFGQESNTETSIHNQLSQQSEEIYDSLIKIRRDFHMNPELSGQEHRTSDKITQYLHSLNLEVKPNIGGYGVVGILKGSNEGRHIAWRADIDAFKTDFPDIVDFKSEIPGVRHICGHDVHTTIGLGIANILSKNRNLINGTVYFIFQPSEENFKGAKAMIDGGLFDIISPDEIYGLHIIPMPQGFISAKTGSVYAHMNVIDISLQNLENLDSTIHYIKGVVSSFQNVKPDSKFWDSRNLGDPNVGVSHPNTVYKDYLIVDNNFQVEQSNNQFIIRTVLTCSNKKYLDSIPELIKQRIADSKYSEKLLSVNYSMEHPTVINDNNLAAETRESISKIYGEQSVIPIYGVIPNFNDDFAYFQHQIPGVYYFLGGSNYQNGLISMPHSPNFAVDEECIKTGVKYFSSMIVERLKDKK